MSYVQGTTVRLRADFSDPVTGDPVVPDEVILTVVPPEPLEAFERTLLAGEVQVDASRQGRVFYVLETDGAAGTWRYQFEVPQPGRRVVARKAITVTRRLDVPA